MRNAYAIICIQMKKVAGCRKGRLRNSAKKLPERESNLASLQNTVTTGEVCNLNKKVRGRKFNSLFLPHFSYFPCIKLPS